MAYGDGTGWDETLPLDSVLISNLPVAIREVNEGLVIRLEKEHDTFASSSAGGEHKAGSAKAYAQTTYPTKRPNTTSDLSSSDKGRLLIITTDGHAEYYDGTGWFKIITTDPDQIADGLLTKEHVATGFTKGILPYARIVDAKSDTTDGGTFTSGAWRTRVLNTENTDVGTIVAVASDQITLDAGTYRIRASAPAQQVGSHQCRWYDITNAAAVAYGTTEQAPSGTAVVTRSWVETEFIVADDDTVFELQHRCQTTKSGSGFGLNGAMGVGEIYSVVEIWKLL